MTSVKLPSWRQRTPHEEFIRITDLIRFDIQKFKKDELDGLTFGTSIEKYTEELKKLEYFLANPEDW